MKTIAVLMTTNLNAKSNINIMRLTIGTPFVMNDIYVVLYIIIVMMTVRKIREHVNKTI